MSINIVGISTFHQDSACCLLQDGVVKAAVKEECFTRAKNDRSIPGKSFLYCLNRTELSIKDIDCIAYFEIPEKRLARQLWAGIDAEKKSLRNRMDPMRPEREIRELLGYEGPIEFIDWSSSQTAGAYYFSGFEEAAILILDSAAGWETGILGYGKDNKINVTEKDIYPHSISLFYSAVTDYLGFDPYNEEHLTMMLSAYGKPVYTDKIRKMIRIEEQGGFELIMDYFDFTSETQLYSQAMFDLLGEPSHKGTRIEEFHKDIAASLQAVVEEVVLKKVGYLHEMTGSKNICIGGKASFNSMLTAKIGRESKFENIFVPPAAGDCWCAVGAAAAAYHGMTRGMGRIDRVEHSMYGPEYDYEDIKSLLEASSLIYENYHNKTSLLLERTAGLLKTGKLVGWFHGGIELDKMAAGTRAILANPMEEGIQLRMGAAVKNKSMLDRIGVVTLKEEVGNYFDSDKASPFTMNMYGILSTKPVPAAIDPDGNIWVQTADDKNNSRMAQLILQFGKLTGCKMLLGLPLAMKGEVVAGSPVDALILFINSEIDCMVLEDFVIEKSKNSLEMLRRILATLKLGGAKSVNRRMPV